MFSLTSYYIFYYYLHPNTNQKIMKFIFQMNFIVTKLKFLNKLTEEKKNFHFVKSFRERSTRSLRPEKKQKITGLIFSKFSPRGRCLGFTSIFLIKISYLFSSIFFISILIHSKTKCGFFKKKREGVVGWGGEGGRALVRKIIVLFWSFLSFIPFSKQ